MLAILGLLAPIFQGIITGVVQPLVGYFSNKDTLNEQGFSIAAVQDAEVQKAWITAQVQFAQLQASSNQWWGARLIILVVAGCCALHFGAVVLDSVPIFSHVVGSWAVPKLPAPYDLYEKQIILSFFLITQTGPAITAVSSWLHRK